MNNYFLFLKVLMDNTIINPIDNSNNIVINKVKSIGLFTKLEKFFFFFAIYLSPFLSFVLLYLKILFYMIFSPITHTINVITLNITTTLFSVHPDNSK